MSNERWDILLPGIRLHTPNELIRMHHHDYRKYRDTLYWLVRKELPRPPPKEPLRYCKVYVTLARKSPLDIDSKYGAVKPVLDVLQPPRNHGMRGGRSMGVGLIANDSDGEAGAAGVIRELRVRQERSEKEYVAMTVLAT